MDDSDPVLIYTDGACKGNPGPGGWGVILRRGMKRRELKGGDAATTNNRMELTAAIRALEALNRPLRVKVFTDSQYVRDGITTWLPKWKKAGWRTADRKLVKNVDLWEVLDALTQHHTVVWTWIRAHDGNVENERADALANEGMAPFLGASAPV